MGSQPLANASGDWPPSSHSHGLKPDWPMVSVQKWPSTPPHSLNTMPNNNTHALVSAPLRIPQDYVRTDEESTAAEWTSDEARNSLESTAFKTDEEHTNAVSGPRQTQLVKLSLSPSVAQPSPTSVMRRSVQNTFEPVLLSCSAVLCGHAGSSSARHLREYDSCPSSKHAARQQAQHASNGHVFRTRRLARRQWLQIRADIAMVVLAAMISESSAAFAPNSRAELQAATFGCVGACGQALSGSGDGTYCHWSANGPWESGSGDPCNNAGDSVPNGQGSGAYGVIGDWDVAKVTSMSYSECLVFCWPHATAHYIYLQQQQQQSRVLYTADNLIFFAPPSRAPLCVCILLSLQCFTTQITSTSL